MKHDLRLPQSNKEGLLYGMIICGITAFLMTFLNIYLQFYTVNKEVLFIILKSFPLFFIVAMLLENFVVSRFANKLVEKYSATQDSFNAHILFSIFFTVVGMSFCMTLIGDFIGHGFVLEKGIVARFLMAWPRNFGVVLFIELLIAQPLARKVMSIIHREKSESNLA